MHIRSEKSNDFSFKMVDILFYQKALSFLKKKKISKVMIFTDDLKYSKNLIKKLDSSFEYEFVANYNFSTIEEFYLMSKFKNLKIKIITKSKFF